MKKILSLITALILLPMTACSKSPSVSSDFLSNSSTSSDPGFIDREDAALEMTDLQEWTFIKSEEDFKLQSSKGIVTPSDDNTYSINESGTYEVSGYLEGGQIEIAKNTGKVKLILKGTSIKGSTAAINIKGQNDVIIEILPGTKNYLCDGSSLSFQEIFTTKLKDEPKGTIFSKSNLEIMGSGELYVASTADNIIYNENGQESRESINGIHVKKADLLISNTSLYINAVNNGIKIKGALKLHGSRIQIYSRNDGIQTDYNDMDATGITDVIACDLAIESESDGIQAEKEIIIKSGTLSILTGGGSTSINDGFSHKGLKASNSIAIPTSITIDGGVLNVDALDDALHADNDIYIHNGRLVISTGDDAIHADGNLVFETGNPEVFILKSHEGLEAHDITIDTGYINIIASDDGINSAGGNDSSSVVSLLKKIQISPWGRSNPGMEDDACLTINGGIIIIDSEGDGLDANGQIKMTGGIVLIYGPGSNNENSIDYDTKFILTGGTLIALGNSMKSKAPSSDSTQPVVQYTGLQIAPNTLVGLTSNDSALIVFKTKKNFTSLIVSTPNFKVGQNLNLYQNGFSNADCRTICTNKYDHGDLINSAFLSTIINKVNVTLKY